MFSVPLVDASVQLTRDNGISFHRFPLGNAILLNLVFTVARRAGLSLPIKENARVCSIHFCKEDFVGVEGYAPSKPKLKSDAVPSLLLFNDPTFSKNSYCNGHSTTCGHDSVRLATYLEVYY